MFRLFRRKKKEVNKEIVEEEALVEEVIEEETIVPESTVTKTIVDSVQEATVFETKEIPFEDKFTHLTHILPESLLEDDLSAEKQIILPFIRNVLEQDSSFTDFISPQVLSQFSSKGLQPREQEYIISRKELPPTSLEERIEGALFSVGRPIHADEIIESFEEDSPTIKRAIRRLSRKRKRNSALVIEEISKDRWVMQLNPLFHEFFHSLLPDHFLLEDERRVLTEIAYRQPISLAMVKNMVVGIGPIRVNEICRKLEEQNFIVSEERARSLLLTSTPKFAKSFGFDNESRRLKLQMLWRLKRLMGDFEDEESEDLEEEDEGDGISPITKPIEPESEIKSINGAQTNPSLQDISIEEDRIPQTHEGTPITINETLEGSDTYIREVTEIKIMENGEEE